MDPHNLMRSLTSAQQKRRLKAMATSMKDLVGDPLDDFAKKFTEEFIQLGIRTVCHFCCRFGKKQVDPLSDGAIEREREIVFKLWGLPRAVETSISYVSYENVPKKQGCSCLF